MATHELGQVLLGAAAFRLLWVEPSAGESQPSTEALRGTDAIPSADCINKEKVMRTLRTITHKGWLGGCVLVELLLLLNPIH